MFEVKINEKEYVVCSEGEFNFLGNITSPVFIIPKYLDLDYKVGTQTVIKITNNVPIIIDKSNLTSQNKFNRSIGVNFEAIYPLELEEVEILNELSTDTNPFNTQIKKDLEEAKQLIKTNKECK